MRITDFLPEGNCLRGFLSGGKEKILGELCALVAESGAISGGEEALAAVLAREKLGSTGIGDEVAIPHAKTAGVKELTGAFGVSKEGVEYFSVDDKPVKLVFLLLAPENSTGAHLKALARVSRLLKSERFRSRMEEAQDPSLIYPILAEEDENLG
ncbi:MAG: PTS sugar transporter subunit IIA [Nitrospinae bacterium]|nr:PTS sugar transporter subunit IIA [Nitrospinota bacterium]